MGTCTQVKASFANFISSGFEQNRNHFKGSVLVYEWYCTVNFQNFIHFLFYVFTFLHCSIFFHIVRFLHFYFFTSLHFLFGWLRRKCVCVSVEWSGDDLSRQLPGRFSQLDTIYLIHRSGYILQYSRRLSIILQSRPFISTFIPPFLVHSALFIFFAAKNI